MGLERVIDNIIRQEVPVPDNPVTKVLVAHMGEKAKLEAIKLSSNLRQTGANSVLGPSARGLRGQLRYASSINATHVVIIGDDELEKGIVVLRDMREHSQQELPPQRNHTGADRAVLMPGGRVSVPPGSSNPVQIHKVL